MGLFSKRRTPLDDGDSWLGLGGLLRLGRNLLCLAITGVVLVGLAGEPFLRWEYRYRGSHNDPQITDATYVGVSGRFEARAHQYGEGCPLILFVKPDPPLTHRLIRRFFSLFH